MKGEYRGRRRRGYRGAPRNGQAKRRPRRAPTRDRRVARQGEDDRGLPRQGLHGRVVDRPYPRPPAQRRRGSGRPRSRSRGRASASTSTTTSSRSTSSTRRRRRSSRDLRAKLKDADELLLATDEDREGEAIAWHLVQVLKPKVPVRRMVFHEITKPAIERALEETREIDDRLVDAQETRRILDRLYGYEVSPVLWRKVMKGLSAGRVQSVATRLVVERERERIEFRAAEYWDIVAHVRIPASSTRGSTAVDGRKVAQGRDFARNGTLIDRRRRPARRGRRAAASPRRSRAPRSPSARSSASRTRAARPRRS